MRIPLDATSTLPITYHNVAEIEPEPAGLTLQRVPAVWRARWPEQTAFRATQAGGVELRFYARTHHVGLELTAETQMGYTAALALYHGRRNVGLATLTTPRFDGVVTLIERDDDFDGMAEQPWRILCPYGARTTVCALHLSEGVALLPLPTLAAPRPVRWLAHGDSITHGAHALHPGYTYVNLVADALGWDALNLGFGGSAWGDAAVAEYIAARDDWDVLSLAIGTNTYGGAKESAADYRQRYARFLEIIRAAHPTKPVVCVTPFWRAADGPPAVPNRYGDPPQAYRDAIAAAVSAHQANDHHLVLVDGLEIVGDDRGLTVDRLHPDPHGMGRIAQHLAPILARTLAS